MPWLYVCLVSTLLQITEMFSLLMMHFYNGVFYIKVGLKRSINVFCKMMSVGFDLICFCNIDDSRFCLLHVELQLQV